MEGGISVRLTDVPPSVCLCGCGVSLQIGRKFVGNTDEAIGGRVPDFICESLRVVLEVFHSVYKLKRWLSVEAYCQERIAHFEKYGYRVIFLSEEELDGVAWKEKSLRKIFETLRGWLHVDYC